MRGWFLLVITGAVIGCGQREDAPVDASADTTIDRIHPLVDAGIDGNIPCNEASTGTQWPGWSRVTEADMCCTVEVPDDVDASVDPLTWVPCTNDAGTGCTEMPITWGVQPNWARFDFASVTPTDSPSIVSVGRLIQAGFVEIDMYSFATGAPVAAWRVNGTIDTAWAAEPYPTANHVWVFIAGSRDAQNIPPTNMTAYATLASAEHPKPFYAVPPGYEAIQDFWASDTTVAFDLEPAGRIVRMSTSALGKYVLNAGVDGLIFPLVHGDDVFAECPLCNAGWTEEYRVDPDGTTVVFRAKPNCHVANFASDGARIYWTESYGGSTNGLQQASTDVWSAPYTSDPATLEATAQKIASANGASAYDHNGIAFQGYYAIITSPTRATVIRAADGAVQDVSSGPDRMFGDLIYVSSTDVWALMKDVNITAPFADEFQRTALAAWP